MSEMEHVGEIAVARILNFSKDDYLFYEASILSGNLEGSFCYVLHNSKPNSLIDKEVLVRFDKAPEEISHSNFSSDFVGHFLSDDVPNQHFWCEPEDALLYAFWEDWMKKENLFPFIRHFEKFYNPGKMELNLHFYYSEKECAVFATKLIDNKSVKTESFSKFLGSRLDVYCALRSYLAQMDCFQKKKPRVVTIDSKIFAEDWIIPTLYETGLNVINLQP